MIGQCFPSERSPSRYLQKTHPEYNGLLDDIAKFFDWLQANGGGSQGRALGFVKSHALQYAASSPKAGFAFLLRRLLRHFDDDFPEKTLLEWVGLLIPYRHWSETQKPQNLLRELRKSVAETESDDEADDDLGSSVGPTGAGRLRGEERTQLGRLLKRYASQLSKPEANAKFEVLSERLLSADEPFVVFAQSVDTVYEVKRFVERQGIPCCLIVGGQDPTERRRTIDQFTSSGRLGRRVLVSSSAGGEGINLQVSRRLIHFDLPWNPMVLEQRIGRVHRIGTVDTVVVDTILLKDSREADIYERLMRRLLAIVTDLTDDESLRGQYFRRIMAGIPLEDLRELFGGDIEDDAAIGRAVDAGREHVEQVDKELRQHRVAELPEDRGRAKMDHLVELLERSGSIEKTSESVAYSRVVFDDESESFRAVRESARRFAIKDGRRRVPERWLVFNREAATRAPSVARDNSGGIDHPIVGVALQGIRTPRFLEGMRSLAVGLGAFDRDYLEYFSGGTEEPVIMLSYVSARLIGEYYFDHELHLFAVSASNSTAEKLGREDAELVERIVWDNLRYEGSRLACPELSRGLTARLVEEDGRIRTELAEDMREESGRWIGAVWPLAATILVPR